MCIPTLTGYICACADGMDMKDKFTCTQGIKYTLAIANLTNYTFN